jgi:hypothetical protein
MSFNTHVVYPALASLSLCFTPSIGLSQNTTGPSSIQPPSNQYCDLQVTDGNTDILVKENALIIEQGDEWLVIESDGETEWIPLDHVLSVSACADLPWPDELVSVSSQPAVANATPESAINLLKSDKILRHGALGLQAGLLRFDTNITFVDGETGLGGLIDAEGTLGLPDTQAVPIIYGYFRPWEKHGFGLGYFSINRSSTVLLVDKDIGDVNISGNVKLEDNTSFITFTYDYAFYSDDRALLLLNVGLYGIDLDYQLNATGSISLGEIAVVGEYKQRANVFAPVPLIGLDAWFTLTDKWMVGSKLSFVGGSFNDVSAVIFAADMRAVYEFNKSISLVLGATYFSADIDVDKDDFYNIRYDIDGLTAGLEWDF